MGILDGILSPITSLASGILGFAGQKDANQTNQQIAEQNSAFNAEEAAKTRQFQHDVILEGERYGTEMSNTSYQRGVKDMEAAGLNPMLAYSQGGASAPQGMSSGAAQATAVQPAPMLNSAGAGVAAAAQAAARDQTLAQVDKTTAEADNVRADTALKDALMPTGRNNGSVIAANINAQTGLYNHQASVATNQAAAILASTDLTKEQINKVTVEIANAIKEGRKIDAQTGNIKVDTALRNLEIPQASAEAKFYHDNPGFVPAQKYLDVGGKILNSAGSITRLPRGLAK